MNEKQFFDAVRSHVGPLTQANVVGFQRVLKEALKRGTSLGHLSDILATAWWESGKTMAPVEEAYYLGPARAKAVQKKFRYFPYYGRGLVQLTWLENYRKVGQFYGIDLVNKPELALDPDISVRVLFDGMTQGWFTGKKLDDYIDDKDEPDAEDLREYIAARRIVNGTDKAKEIGKLALMFEGALKAGGYGKPSVVPPRQPNAPLTPEPSGFWTWLIRTILRSFSGGK